MFSQKSFRWTAVFSLIAILFDSAESIKCYQCTSTDTDNPYQCGETMTGNEDIQPEPCDKLHDSKFCLKFTGRNEDGIMTIRSCSSLDRGDICIYGHQSGDILDYRSCWYTCSTDGCNTATSGRPSILQILVVTVLSIFSYNML